MAERRPIRVAIVDDHLVVREGLALLVTTYEDLEVVAQARDGAEAIERCAELQPEVVLMDLSMPGVDGPTAIAHLHAEYPQMQFIALTSMLDEKSIRQALGAGAIGYLLKSASGDQLADAIRGAARGEPTLDARAGQMLVQSVTSPPQPGHDLTAREREVLALLVEGKTNREIGETLTLSYGTVRVYVSRILAKLGASNRTEAVALALQNDSLWDET
jgi:DNA-binding NarL/FixJ family response regulator